jgi:predicted dehydrogenase
MHISWGIIGCGNVTEVKSGPAFNKVPDSKLVAVMRRNKEKAKDYAARHKVPKWYSDADQLINDPEVNAIYVATPPSSHEEYAIKAMEAGKPVYIEKPMATNAGAAKRIAEMSLQAGIKVCIAHYRRQQPLFLKIKSLLDEKAIGEPRLVNLRCWQPHESDMIAKTDENWRLDPSISGGGLFHDLSPHQIDLMIYFFGKPKEAKGIAFNAAGIYEADDTVAGQIVFENKVLFNGSWCFTIDKKEEWCEITGSKGSLRFSIFEHQPLVITQHGKEKSISFDKLQHVQQPMIERVVQYFLDKAKNPCSAEEGMEVMKLIDQLSAKK